MGLSFLLHVAVFSVSYYLIMRAVEENAEEVTIELYMGKYTGKEGEGSGEGQGSSRPALQRGSDQITEEEIANPNQNRQRAEGREDGFEDGTGVDWGKGLDPALDGGSRYTANIVVEVSPDDYPASARKVNLGTVTVAVRLYISSSGRIRAVNVRYVRSPGNAARPFEQDFVLAARNLFLRKARLVNVPYQREGEYRDFVWDTKVDFFLR